MNGFIEFENEPEDDATFKEALDNAMKSKICIMMIDYR
jgi:hypothetical protein